MVRITARLLRRLTVAAHATCAHVACGCYGSHEAEQLNIMVEVEPCPGIEGLTALPLEVIVGGDVELAADVRGDLSSLIWSAENGAFADRNAPATKYRCMVSGKQVLTLTISEGSLCEQEVELEVTCSGNPYCGNGELDFGEQCDDGNLLGDDDCSLECKSAVPVPVD